MVATDRWWVEVGAYIPSGGSSTHSVTASFAFEGTLNGNYDSTGILPAIAQTPASIAVSPQNPYIAVSSTQQHTAAHCNCHLQRWKHSRCHRNGELDFLCNPGRYCQFVRSHKWTGGWIVLDLSYRGRGHVFYDGERDAVAVTFDQRLAG